MIKERQKEGEELETNPPPVLRIFQIYLKAVPNWSRHIVEKETGRIRSQSRCAEWFDDLVKAVIKSHIVLLTFSATEKQCDLVNRKLHDQVSTDELVHKIYIECAHSFYNYSELFWHGYEPLDIKRNQREILQIIKESIREAIRKLLPMKMVLHEFLQNDYIRDDEDENIEYDITDSHFVNIKTMVDKDINGAEHQIGGDDNSVRATVDNANYETHDIREKLESIRQSTHDENRDSSNEPPKKQKHYSPIHTNSPPKADSKIPPAKPIKRKMRLPQPVVNKTGNKGDGSNTDSSSIPSMKSGCSDKRTSHSSLNDKENNRSREKSDSANSKSKKTKVSPHDPNDESEVERRLQFSSYMDDL